jgi:hypothetical protein
LIRLSVFYLDPAGTDNLPKHRERIEWCARLIGGMQRMFLSHSGFVLCDGSGQCCCVCKVAGQVQSFHDAVVALERHHHGVSFRIAEADNRYIRVLNYLVQYGFERIARIKV